MLTTGAVSCGYRGPYKMNRLPSIIMLVCVGLLVIVQSKDIPVPRFTINLDLPAKERWTAVAKLYKVKLNKLLMQGMDDKPNHLLSITAGSLLPYLRQPYRDEILGIAMSTNMPAGKLAYWTIIYALSVFRLPKMCTSIVAEDSKGNIIHARNLDMEWWTDALKELAITVDFQKGGRTLYTGTTVAGAVGLTSGQKPDSFTVTANERDKGEWWMNADWASNIGTRGIPSLLVRDLLANSKSNFESAVRTLANTPLIAPVYFIVGGTQPEEGVVITHNRSRAIDVMRLDTSKGHWYVLETNYDHWKPVPPTDNRRGSAIDALNEIGRDKISPSKLYEVLSQPPVMSNITIFTMIMAAAKPDLYFANIRK